MYIHHFRTNYPDSYSPTINPSLQLRRRAREAFIAYMHRSHEMGIKPSITFDKYLEAWKQFCD